MLSQMRPQLGVGPILTRDETSPPSPFCFEADAQNRPKAMGREEDQKNAKRNQATGSLNSRTKDRFTGAVEMERQELVLSPRGSQQHVDQNHESDRQRSEKEEPQVTFATVVEEKLVATSFVDSLGRVTDWGLLRC